MIPVIRKLEGERRRNFVLSREGEQKYLEAAQQPLRDAALLLLDTGLRVGELMALERSDIHLEPTNGAKFGYLRVKSGKSKNSTRAVSLTCRVSVMLRERMASNDSLWVFPGRGDATDSAFLSTSLDCQHSRTRTALARLAQRLCATFAPSHVPNATRGSRGGCVHDNADSGTQ